MKGLKLGVCVLSFVFASGVFAAQDLPESETSIAAVMGGSKTTEVKESVSKEVKETKQYLSDTEITAKVKETFIKEKLFGKEEISAMGISVKTTKGVVTLTGKAASQEDADNAVKLAKGVEGVKDVKSKIKVKAAKK